MKPTADDAFEQRSRKVLDSSVEHLDGRVLSRLNRARHTALESATSATAPWRLLVPAGMAAAAAVAVVMSIGVGRDSREGSIPKTASVVLEDVDLLSDAEAFELAGGAEIEFYEWAAAQSADGVGS